MYDFYNFDVYNFLKDSYSWEKKIKKIDELISNKKPQEEFEGQQSMLPETEEEKKTETSDEVLLKEKEHYKELIRVKTTVMRKLPESDRDLIHVFFGKFDKQDKSEQHSFISMPKEKPISTVEEYQEKYNCSRGKVFVDKGKLLKRLTDMLAYTDVDGVLDDYYRFNVNDFLTQSAHWPKKIAELKKTIEELNYLKSPSFNSAYAGRTYNISRPVETAVLKLEEFGEEINILEENLKIRDREIGKLKPIEYDMIQMTFLQPNSHISKQVRRERIMEKHAISESKAYRHLNRGKENIQKSIEKAFPHRPNL